jgi:aryl-alcohol dehydrogenase-like predicted oxidoreductase
MTNPAVTSDVVGLSSMEQLNEVVSTDESEKLTESDLERLRNALPAKFYELHR